MGNLCLVISFFVGDPLFRHPYMLSQEKGVEKKSVRAIPGTPEIWVVCKQDDPSPAYGADYKGRGIL